MLHLYLTGKPDIHLTLMNKRWKRKFKPQIKAGAVIFYVMFNVIFNEDDENEIKMF